LVKWVWKKVWKPIWPGAIEGWDSLLGALALALAWGGVERFGQTWALNKGFPHQGDFGPPLLGPEGFSITKGPKVG